MTNNDYLLKIISKYNPRQLSSYSTHIALLKAHLVLWAGTCYSDIIVSGSRAKGTAIHLSSDVDYIVSLNSSCNENNGGLQSIYESLYQELKIHYKNVRKQNVSFRILLGDLEVDITPARKLPGSSNYHWLYVSKKDTWQQTNIQIHINDISQSGRLKEIKLLKIWRELNQLEFPSVYLEYLVVNNILYNKSKDPNKLINNFLYILLCLAKNANNPLSSRIVDPANSKNILSDLLSISEKKHITDKAYESLKSGNLLKILY